MKLRKKEFLSCINIYQSMQQFTHKTAVEAILESKILPLVNFYFKLFTFFFFFVYFLSI